MFFKLALPERSSSKAPKCWVPVLDDNLEMFLLIDGNVDAGDGEIVEYLFETYNEAILASAEYYNNHAEAYPYTKELYDALDCIVLTTITESKIMRFK